MKNTLKAALLISSALVATPALAQAVLEAPPPTHYSLDERGVDVITGKVVHSTVDVSIGDVNAGGLAYVRNFIGGGMRDNIIGAVDPFGGGITVSIGGKSEEFTGSGPTFTPVAATGSTLTKSGNLYTYRIADGTTAVFSMAYSGSAGQARGYGIISLTRPNGAALAYAYTTVVVPKYPGADPVVRANRLHSVTSNAGYRLTLNYALDDPPTTTYLNQFHRLTGVTASNLATTESHPWPYVTYVDGVNRSGQVSRYSFGSSGLTAIRYPGSTADDIVVSYDGAGRVATWADHGDAWTYEYSASGPTLTTVVTNPLGEAETYVSNTTANRLTSFSDPDGKTTSYMYDAQGRVTRRTLPEGNYTQYTYDARGNITTTTHVPKPGSGLSNLTTSATFPSTCANPVTCNRPTSTTDARGGVTNYAWNATHGGLESVTLPAPTTGAVRPQTRIAYAPQTAYYKNSVGVIAAAPSAVTLPVSTSTCATGSAPACVGTADELRTTINYGTAGAANNLLPTAIVQRNGDATLSRGTSIAYTPNGDVAQVNGPLNGSGDTTFYRYDDARQLIGVIGPDPDGAGALLRRAQRYTYNPRGAVTLVEQGTVAGATDANWSAFASLQQAATAYDVYGRPTHQRVQAGGTTTSLTQTSYDAAGRQDCVTTRMNPTTFASPPASACTLATAGAFGPDRVMKAGYDAAGRLISTTAGFGSGTTITESVTYTSNGKPQNLVDGKGNTSILVYDGFDRLSRIRYPSASDGSPTTSDYENYSYDAASNVTSHRNRAGELTSIGYDALNRPTTMGGSAVAARTFAYDNLDRPRTATLSGGGGSVSNTYDAFGRLLSQTQAGVGTVGYGYDQADRRISMSWPDGFWVAYDYNLANDLTAIRENGATDWELASWTRNNLGQTTLLTRANGANTAWTYSAAHQVSRIRHNLAGTADDLNIDFTYNPAGQIVSRTMSNPAYVYAPGAGTINYVNNGKNQVTSVGGAALTYDGRQNIAAAPTVGSYGYNGLNELTSATVGGTTTGLSYDPAGRLYQVGTTRFLYDGQQAIGEYDTSGNVLKRYVPGLGLDNVVTAYEGAGYDRRWLYADERGSVVGIADDTAAAVATNTYDEYGVPGSGNSGRFQYTGQMWLPQAQLYHYRARAYAPTLGRFLQTDPIGYGDGANLYGYVGGDPVNMVDPTGMAAFIRTCMSGVTAAYYGADGSWYPGDPWVSCSYSSFGEPDLGGRGGLGGELGGGGLGGGGRGGGPRVGNLPMVTLNPSREEFGRCGQLLGASDVLDDVSTWFGRASFASASVGVGALIVPGAGEVVAAGAFGFAAGLGGVGAGLSLTSDVLYGVATGDWTGAIVNSTFGFAAGRGLFAPNGFSGQFGNAITGWTGGEFVNSSGFKRAACDD